MQEDIKGLQWYGGEGGGEVVGDEEWGNTR
jgi:hypothetical protein